MRTITFIGNGNMALSIAKGLHEKYNIEVVGRNQKKLDNFANNLGFRIDTYLLKDFDMSNKTVLLCVKPNNIEEIGKILQGKADLLISVLAGTTIENIKKYLKPKSIVRSMPNLAASIGQSMTTLTGDVTAKDEAIAILNSIGETLWLNSEKEIDVATALAGSGPAYLALIAEALADGAVKQGLKREDAMLVMRGLFGGFGTLIQEIHPSLLKDSVMSPGGTTAAGYGALEDGNVRASCMSAIQQANERAKALSS
ncbi:MAG: pyrroline-5-carboxylate reductase [Sulfurovum sp.]|nr:pyrroline-5-carboxylate reductase [Sulfurovum sp.]